MKRVFRIAAIILVLVQLFMISASAADGVTTSTADKMKAAAKNKTTTDTVPVSSTEKMKEAANSTEPKTSGAEEGSAAAEKAEKAVKEKEAAAALAAKKAADDKNSKVDYEIAPVTQFGTAEDVMIGGLRITPGVWYTVDNEGVLTSSKPWPNSYLYYSASQSKLTLHEFHYKVPTDTIGKESTYAALYLPKDMHIVLEGENELINTSYTTAGGGVSNGVYAPDHHISIEGNGTLYVNTRSTDGFKGYGIQAGSIRIDSEFTGLAVFGMTSAFSCAPSVAEGKGIAIDTSLFSGYNDYVQAYKDIEAFGSRYGLDVSDVLHALGSVPTAPQGREMLANVADLHPQYHEDVHVREASPYDRSIFTRFRYVLFVVGGEISWEKEMRAKVEAEYYRNKMEYNLGMEQGYAEAYGGFTTEVGNGLIEYGAAMDQGFSEMHDQGVEMGLPPNWTENILNDQNNNTEPENEWEAYINSYNQSVTAEMDNAASQLWDMLMGGN